MSEHQPPLAPRLKAALAAAGLDPERIAVHQARIRDALVHRRKPQLAIQDACRRDNGGIIPLPADAGAEAALPGYVAFVPAAGAATRYSRPLDDLVGQLSGEAGGDPSASLEALRREGAADWPLPKRVLELLAAPARAATLTEAERADLLAEMQLPKALMPCVRGNLTFLEMKLREHAAIGPFAGEIFVIPPGSGDRFRQVAAEARGRIGGKCHAPVFMEQGVDLSTIRFTTDGRPWFDAEGAVAPVPGGHGELTRLLPRVAERFPAAGAIFIRNIDNVMGTGDAALAATRAFLGLHAGLLAAMREIRAALRAGAPERAGAAAETLARLCPEPAALSALTVAFEERLAAAPAPLRPLWRVMGRLFHPPTDATAGRLDLAAARRMAERPVNLLGQVPNTGADIGGTPCYVKTPAGPARICLEVPHASTEDRDRFLAVPTVATHFNPVFAAVELTADPDQYARDTDGLWILSEKSYRGQKVVYHETVLYELLSLSTVANCLFVEVPRLVFNPHKTLADARGRSAADWLPP